MSNRRQCVFINGIRSEIVNLEFGVPQGSCLGPIMYTQYPSSLFEVIQKQLINVHAYADDHQLYMSFSPNVLDDQDKAFHPWLTEIPAPDGGPGSDVIS